MKANLRVSKSPSRFITLFYIRTAQSGCSHRTISYSLIFRNFNSQTWLRFMRLPEHPVHVQHRFPIIGHQRPRRDQLCYQVSIDSRPKGSGTKPGEITELDLLLLQSRSSMAPDYRQRQYRVRMYVRVSMRVCFNIRTSVCVCVSLVSSEHARAQVFRLFLSIVRAKQPRKCDASLFSLSLSHPFSLDISRQCFGTFWSWITVVGL